MTHTANSPRRFSILQMESHFIYLPLYYAASKAINFFGFLPNGTEVTVETTPQHTDLAVTNALLAAHTRSPQQAVPLLAICDPSHTFIGRAKHPTRPVVLASWIRNGAFWVINHSTNNTHSLRDLGQFDEVIAFREGSTSFGIAKRAMLAAGRDTSRIRCVDPNMELPDLERLGGNRAALTPDALGLSMLLGRDQRYNIEYEVSKSAEYRGVCITSVLGRMDTVAAHADVVSGVLAGLQRALFAVHSLEDGVIEYASERFNCSREQAERALKLARDNHVYSLNLSMSEGEWLATCIAACDSNGIKIDESIRKESSRMYADCIAPFRHLCQRAMSMAIHTPQRQSEHKGSVRASVIAGAVVFGVMTGSLILGYKHQMLIDVAIIGGIVVLWMLISLRYSLYKLVDAHVLHWILAVLFIVFLFLFRHDIVKLEWFVAVGVAALLVDVGFVGSIMANRHARKDA
jgi:hypothetical protein